MAFFPPVTDAELQKHPDTNETLADFQLYAARTRKRLQNSRIRFQEIYTKSFTVRIGKKATTFHPARGSVGYYFIAPGKKPRVAYGVMTDDDLLQVANEYFGTALK